MSVRKDRKTNTLCCRQKKKNHTHDSRRAGWMISAVRWRCHPSLGIRYHDVITDTDTLKHHRREGKGGVCRQMCARGTKEETNGNMKLLCVCVCVCLMYMFLISDDERDDMRD